MIFSTTDTHISEVNQISASDGIIRYYLQFQLNWSYTKLILLKADLAGPQEVQQNNITSLPEGLSNPPPPPPISVTVSLNTNYNIYDNLLKKTECRF